MKNKNDASLFIRLQVGIAKTINFNFNRFRYIGVPKSFYLSSGVFANRDEQIRRWHYALSTNNEYTDPTKHSYLQDFAKYVKFSDLMKTPPESKEAVELWEQNLIEKVRMQQMHVNTARKHLSSTKKILEILDCPIRDWFSRVGLFRSEVNPTAGYSDNELKSLVRILHKFFRQLYQQIKADPQKHINAATNNKTATFSFQDKEIPLGAVVTKCFAAGYFLLAYYTWANCTTLLKMKKSNSKDGEFGKWHSQSVLKKRANKFVTVSIGDNGTFHIPKSALTFINKLNSLSELVSPESEHLFFQCKGGKLAPLETYHIRTFTNWLLENFTLLSDNNLPLRPEAKKFRASGSTRYLMATDNDLEASILLGNSPSTVRKHYSSGNKSDNDAQLQAVAYTLEGAIKCSNISNAKDYAKREMEIEILPYEDFISKYSRYAISPDKTVIGTGCKNSNDVQAEKYRKKINLNTKDVDVSHLACADIMNCFFCPNQVIIEEVEDIWCLLSFKEMIIESRQEHINTQQFNRNFSETLQRIELALFSISPKIRRQSQRYLENNGRHPLWPEGINQLY